MENLRRLYRVTRSIRSLAGAAGVAVLVSLPALSSTGSKFGTFMVVGCGLFSASVALFGRGQVASAGSGLRT